MANENIQKTRELMTIENMQKTIESKTAKRLTVEDIKNHRENKVILTAEQLTFELISLANDDRKNWAKRAYLLKIFKENYSKEFVSMKSYSEAIERIFDIKKSQQANLIRLAEIAVNPDTLDVKEIYKGFTQTQIIEMFSVEGMTSDDIEKAIQTSEIHANMTAATVRKKAQEIAQRNKAVEVEAEDKTEAETEAQTEAKTEAKPEVKPEAKTKENPEPVTEEKPEPESESIEWTNALITTAFDAWLEQHTAYIATEKHRVMILNLEHEHFVKHLEEVENHIEQILKGVNPLDLR